ncbi:PilZ domain-containing protein [Polyangium sorediatum]|uniref:PilZ domain-containing protein n=1 Tax=Polyangium sorediatum TaxID=889274 RepID=A0ABT6NP07_9BACT|nr:PilZ domain-containing protein [Polyangium sorediatum]MDI1429947.1 PilZ domain-containing protein [Polyangium sorediatum]
MEMLLVNERRVPRHAVTVECQVVREDDFTMLGARGVDLSTCGMLLVADVPATVGDDVLISLRIPGREQWIDARGKVTRIADELAAHEGRRGVGIAFELPPGGTRHALEEALCAYPTVVSSRAPRVDYAATVDMISLL